MNPVEGDGAEADPEKGNRAPGAGLHVLSREHFRELSSGGGSPDVIKALIAAERSRRMVILRVFHDEVMRQPALMGPLPFVDETWLALERARKAAPDRFAELFMIPQVGNWLAYALRRSRGGAENPAPLYVDFGQINAFTLAVASLARQTFATRVPLREGRVLIPGFGMARFDGCGPWEVADAEVMDGRISLRHNGREVRVPAEPAADAEGWWGLRRLTIGAGPTLTVWLDDLDPMRDLGDPVPAARLSDPEFQRWSELLAGAWQLLQRVQPELVEALAVGVTSIAPLPASAGWDTRSASTGEAFGAILCSPAPDAVTLAVALVHEFMHIKLGGLMHLLPMSEGGDNLCLYAPWRDDPRPLGGLIQGIYAFAGIAAFWRDYRRFAAGIERELAEFEYAYARIQARKGLEAARPVDGVTYHGRAFLDGLETELKSWDSGVATTEIHSLAQLVATGHEVGWRIRHSRPEAEDIAALAESWLAGSPATVEIRPSTVHPDRAMQHWSQGRLGLARRRIIARERYADALSENWGRALTDGDLALFAGDFATAEKGFFLQIKDDPEAVDAWTGLGLALSADPSCPAGMALLTRPEVVKELHRELASRTGAATSPIEVATWVGTVARPRSR